MMMAGDIRERSPSLLAESTRTSKRRKWSNSDDSMIKKEDESDKLCDPSCVSDACAAFDYVIPFFSASLCLSDMQDDIHDQVVPGICRLGRSVGYDDESSDESDSSNPDDDEGGSSSQQQSGFSIGITVTGEDGELEECKHIKHIRPDSPRPDATTLPSLWEEITPATRRRKSVIRVADKWGCSREDAAEMMAAVESAQTMVAHVCTDSRFLPCVLE